MKEKLNKELERLIITFKIDNALRPFLTIKKLRKSWGLYKKNGEIVIDSDMAKTKQGKAILRHEFAHFLQHIRGERVNEKKASKFEVNVKSNYPYYPPKFSVSFNQTKLDMWKK